jgi:hypothetical protein
MVPTSSHMPKQVHILQQVLALITGWEIVTRLIPQPWMSKIKYQSDMLTIIAIYVVYSNVIPLTFHKYLCSKEKILQCMQSNKLVAWLKSMSEQILHVWFHCFDIMTFAIT